jgi:hypothetical protein
MTAIGLARARDLINGKQMSPKTVRRMLAYFTRHEVDKQVLLGTSMAKAVKLGMVGAVMPALPLRERLLNK